MNEFVTPYISKRGPLFKGNYSDVLPYKGDKKDLEFLKSSDTQGDSPIVRLRGKTHTNLLDLSIPEHRDQYSIVFEESINTDSVSITTSQVNWDGGNCYLLLVWREQWYEPTKKVKDIKSPITALLDEPVVEDKEKKEKKEGPKAPEDVVIT